MATTNTTQPTNPANQPSATYVNGARDYASQNAARIDLMGALQYLNQALFRLEHASVEVADIAEELGEHWRALDAARTAIEARLRR